jgi:hypothetical protein
LLLLPLSGKVGIEADPEVLLSDNLVEEKHHQQMRSYRRGALGRDVKPNPATR